MNYITLQNTCIQNLWNRTDLQQVVYNFTQDRITFYQRRLFYSSDVIDTSITTITGTNTYTLPSGFQQATKIRLLQTSTIWIPLGRWDDIRDILNLDVENPPNQSLPAVWAPFNNQFRLYPTPNAAYNLEITGNNSPTAPVNDTDTNFWTNDAASLIIYATCEDICRYYLQNGASADLFHTAMMREYMALQEETRLLQGPLTLRGW